MEKPATPGQQWSWTRTALCAAGIVAAIELLFLLTGASPAARGLLFDPDCYLHLERSFRLMTGAWNANLDPRLNAPFGYAIHWTVLFDALLAAGAWPFVWCGLDLHQALFVWGSAISPLLCMAALAVFAWGVRPYVSGPAYLWLTLLFFTQPQLSGTFLVGRPDHHSLMMALLLAQLAITYALLDGRSKSLWLALGGGILAGIALCTTIEGLLHILLVSLMLAAAWCFLRISALRHLAAYWAGAFAVVLCWLGLTHDHPLLLPFYDRVSVVHLWVLVSGLCGIGIIALTAKRLPRLAALGIGALCAAALVALVFPAFFAGPWPRLEPAVKMFHAQVTELQPLVPASLPDLARFLAAFTAVLLALPFAVRGLLRGPQRPVMLACVVGFGLFGVLSLFQMRWSGELQAVMLLPWTLATRAIWQSTLSIPMPNGKLPLRSVFLMAALALQITPVAMANPPPPPGHTSCDWNQVARALGQLPDQHGVLLTEFWFGPVIIWNSNFDVVGGPYEIASALSDTAAFQTGDAVQARTVLTSRQVRYVLVCGARHDAAALGLKPIAFAVPGFTLYRR